MKKNGTKRALAAIIAAIITLSAPQLAAHPAKAAGAGAFPLRAGGGALVADADTTLAVTFSQRPDTKLITATVQLTNGGAGAETIFIQAVAFAITFDGRAAPYSGPDDGAFDPSGLFAHGKSVADGGEFGRYCRALQHIGENGYDEAIGFDLFGAQYINRGAGGGTVSAKLGAPPGDTNPDLAVAPGETVDVAELRFMPANGQDLLDTGMFGFAHEYDADSCVTLSPLLANGASYLLASADAALPAYTHAASPGAFKIHVLRPLPVSADNIGRAVAGYDSATMEWSHDEGGPYHGGAPAVKHEAHTVYIRGKADAAYGGGDPVFGDYKKYVESHAQVRFEENAAPADYGLADAAISEAGALNRALYTSASLARVDLAVSGVERGLTIAHQAEVDGFAHAIQSAIGALAAKVPVTHISIDSPALTTVVRGQTYSFSVTLNPGAEDDGIVWSVSNPTYAVVIGSNIKMMYTTGTVQLFATDPASGTSGFITLRVV